MILKSPQEWQTNVGLPFVYARQHPTCQPPSRLPDLPLTRTLTVAGRSREQRLANSQTPPLESWPRTHHALACAQVEWDECAARLPPPSGAALCLPVPCLAGSTLTCASSSACRVRCCALTLPPLQHPHAGAHPPPLPCADEGVSRMQTSLRRYVPSTPTPFHTQSTAPVCASPTTLPLLCVAGATAIVWSGAPEPRPRPHITPSHHALATQTLTVPLRAQPRHRHDHRVGREPPARAPRLPLAADAPVCPHSSTRLRLGGSISATN